MRNFDGYDSCNDGDDFYDGYSHQKNISAKIHKLQKIISNFQDIIYRLEKKQEESSEIFDEALDAYNAKIITKKALDKICENCLKSSESIKKDIEEAEQSLADAQTSLANL